jgi:hypothetical protein
MRRKVRVTLPKAMSGGSNGESGRGMTAGLGLNSNTMPWPIMAGEFAQPDIAVNQSLKPVNVEDANLEAELGETAFVPDESGIPALYKIGGKRHYNGGTPLDLPEDSFIFSRDKKMKIGGPILESFGKNKDTKDKFTPAELSSQYKINDFRKVLADPNTDKTQRDTAELMIRNYNLKLAKLGLVQESIKGFPDGIPAISMPYLDITQLDPSQFVAPVNLPTAKYGGDMDQFGNGGPTRYASEAEYKKHLTDPWSKEKEKAQILWNIANPATTSVQYDYAKQLENISNIQKDISDLEQQKSNKALEAKQQAEYKTAIKSAEKKQAHSKWELIALDNTIKKNLENTKRALKGEKVLWGSGDAADNLLTLKKELEGLLKRQSELLKTPETTSASNLVSKSSAKQSVAVTPPVYGAEPVTPVDMVEPISSSSINNTKLIPKPDTVVVASANPYLKLGGTLPKYEPGGPVVTKYSDGTTSTAYPDGKIEVKDASGKLLKTIPGKMTVTTTPTTKKASTKTSFDVYDFPLREKAVAQGYEFIDPADDLRYTKRTVGPQTQSTGYNVDPESGFLYKDIKPGIKGLDNFVKRHKKIINQYPGGEEKWKKDQVSAQGKENSAMTFVVDNLNKIYRGITGEDLVAEKEGKYVPGVELFNLPGISKKEASSLASKSTAPSPTTPGPLSGGVGDEYFAPRPKWWLQDKIKTAGAFGDLMNIKKYQPWQATPGYTLEQGTFYDPTRELAATAEMVNQGVTGASTFSGPQGYAATASMLQGQGAKNVADIMARYNNMNVSEANRLSSINTQIMNQAAQQRAQNATQLYDKQTILNQQFDNAKNMARQNLRQSFLDAITNRANTANLNTLYPQYAVDPSSGGLVYNPEGSNRRPTKEIKSGMTPEDYMTSLKDKGYTDKQLEMIFNATYGKGQSGQTS